MPIDFVELGQHLSASIERFEDDYLKEIDDYKSRLHKAGEREAALRQENAALKQCIEKMKAHPDVKAQEIEEARRTLFAAQKQYDLLANQKYATRPMEVFDRSPLFTIERGAEP